MTTTVPKEAPMVETSQPAPKGQSPLRRAVTSPLLGFLVVLVVLPFVVPWVPFMSTSLLVHAVVLAIAGLGIVILTGYAGQLSIGHAAFFGVGGYTTAMLVGQPSVPPVLAMAIGMTLAGLIAWPVGLLIFRTSGHYLALATLALGLVSETIVKEQSLLGGAVGLPDIPSLALGPIILSDDFSYYWFVAVVLLVVTFLCRNLLGSAEGMKLKALGDSEIATSASGVMPRALKTRSLVISAVLAALAGSLYAHWTSFVDPTMTALMQSVQFLLIVIVGGSRSVWGAFSGALFILFLAEMARETLPRISSSIGGNFEIAVYGIVLVLFLLYVPQGLVGVVQSIGRRTRGRKESESDA